MADNLTRLIKNLNDDMDAALIMSPVSRKYYTGFQSSAGVVVVTREESYFIIDSRYYEAAQHTVRDLRVILEDKRFAQINEILKHHRVKNLALESSFVSMSGYLDYKNALPGVEILFDNRLSAMMALQRQVKNREEISFIDQAQQVTDKVFSHMLNFIKAGKTELDVCVELEYACRRMGSSGAAFDPIVVSGKNSSMPHGVPGERRLEDGDFLTMDFGCTVNGYHSDMTRTVAIGSVSDKMLHVYDTVLVAQLAAIAAVKEGVPCKEVDKTARDIIEGAGYGKYFGHGLGHSIGLEVHENPRFNTTSADIAKCGNVMSVEPGIYLPGEFGVRIEDLVLVTADGCENFAESTKELIIL